MKKISKIASAVVLSAALILGTTTTAFAAVTFQDYQLTVTGSGEYTATDLFDNFKNVMPGDELDQPIAVTNGNSKNVNIYLRAEVHDEASNPLTYSETYEETDGKDQATDPEIGIGGEGQRDETVATMQDFLSQLHMIVTTNGKVVFDAQPHLEAGLSENVLLGEVAPGETMTIDAELLVPIEMGDKYANRVGEVDWVFVVEELDEPLPDTGGEDSKLSQTGDSAPALLLAGFASVAALIAIIAFGRSRKA